MEIVRDNILDMIDVSGEESVRQYLSTFSCPLNQEIENFIRNKAIDFARRKLAITYVISDVVDGAGDVLGYFALTHKAIDVNGDNFSKTDKRKLERYARYDQDRGTYTVSAFLLAQFGKNYGVDGGARIRGEELMEYVDDVLADIQRRIGGGVVYLDCEDEPRLVAFYEDKSRYKPFSVRHSSEDGIKYLQYMKFF